MKKISVIIPSFNSFATIEKVLDALSAQTQEQLILEIVIVDSSSDIETKELLSRHVSEKIKVIPVDHQLIPALSRNLGAEKAGGGILVFIDADVYPDNDWIENIARAYESGCAVGGGSFSLPDFQKNRLIPKAQFYLQLNEYMAVGGMRIKRFIPSGNMFCDRELFRKIGGFTNIRAAEDVLFGLKASKITEVWFIPRIKGHHIFRDNFRSFVNNQTLSGQYAIIYRRIFFPESWYYQNIIPLLLLPVFLCIKSAGILSRVFRAGWRHAFNFLTVSPLILPGLIFWSAGFAKGVLMRQRKTEDSVL